MAFASDRLSVDLSKARALQEKLKTQVVVEDAFEPPRYVAGVDVGFEQDGEVTRAAVVVLSYPSLEVVQTCFARVPTTFPYIPGFLSFRELPAVLEAWKQLEREVQVVFVDGMGIAHPRRLGIASHLGVVLGLPTIGVGKSRLVGEHDEVGAQAGSRQDLFHRDERIGVVLRTKARSNPLYISPGHRVGIDSAVALVESCLRGYRLPEPTRLADKTASTRYKVTKDAVKAG